VAKENVIPLNSFTTKPSVATPTRGVIPLDSFSGATSPISKAISPGVISPSTFSTSLPSKKSSFDLNTVEGLAGLGRGVGLEDKVNSILDTTSKLSVLNRLSKGLGAFTPAEAKKYSLGIAMKAPESKGITANPDGTVIENGILYVPDGKGGYTPAKGLRSSPANSVVAAFANYDTNQKSGKRTLKSPQAIETESTP